LNKLPVFNLRCLLRSKTLAALNLRFFTDVVKGNYEMLNVHKLIHIKSMSLHIRKKALFWFGFGRWPPYIDYKIHEAKCEFVLFVAGKW